MKFRFRGVESSLRSLLVGWAKRLTPRPPSPTAAPAVLYLRYDRIGDMILATGLLRALAQQSSPPVAVDVLASPENVPVLQGNPNVRTIIVYDRRRVLSMIRAFRQIRRTRYEAVLDCQLYAPSTTTLLMMVLSGARRRVGVANRGIDEALTDPMPVPPGAAHTIEHTAALAAAFGIDPVTTDWRPELFLSADEVSAAATQWDDARGIRLLVNISAGKGTCRWTEGNFTTLLKLLVMRHEGLSVLLVAAPNDLAEAARISAATGVPVARTPTIRDALALVATSDIVLTPDTSITHAASALNKPALVLVPPGRDRHWGPYRTTGRAITSPGRWVNTLPVEPVLAALDEMVRSAPTVLEQGTTHP
jgi:ADP-heptose:LPS heptosyltransferase